MQLLVALMSQVLKMTLKILSLLLMFFFELNVVVSILTRKNLSASCLKKNKIFSSLNMNLNEYFFDLFVCLVQFVKCPKYVNVPIFRFSQKLIGFLLLVILSYNVYLESYLFWSPI
jgi:hypothetical protein